MHEKIKDLTNNKKKKQASCIMSKVGELLFEQEDISKRWVEYISL